MRASGDKGKPIRWRRKAISAIGALDLFWRIELGIQIHPDIPLSRGGAVLGSFPQIRSAEGACEDIEATIRARPAPRGPGAARWAQSATAWVGGSPTMTATRTDIDASVGY